MSSTKRLKLKATENKVEDLEQIIRKPRNNESDDESDGEVQLFKASNGKASTQPHASSNNADNKVNNKSVLIKKSKGRSIQQATFKNLGLDDWICENLGKVAISKPTPVQIACIPPVLNGAKLLSASAPTGSGKTAAFALPILDKLARDPYGVFALVLTPTRELALQIGEQFSTLGAPVGVRCEIIIGGLPIVQQQLALAKQPHIVVATPGRFAAHIIGADPPKIDKLKFLVLDESDRLLTPGEGFQNDLLRISKSLTKALPRLQTMLFSATTGGQKDIATVASLGLSSTAEPSFIWDYVSSNNDDEQDGEDEGEKTKEDQQRSAAAAAQLRLVPSTLTQSMCLVPSQAKHAYMAWFMKTLAPAKVVDKSKLVSVTLKTTKNDKQDRAKSMIIFTSTCEQCQIYSEMLVQLQVPCAAIHAELPQKKRMDNLTKFRSGQVSILLATDVASRGLDIPQVDVVLNLDVPRECENYVHRIGRCARAGRLGRSFLFVTQNEVNLVKAIESYTKQRLDTFEINDDEVTAVLHKASVAKRKAVMKLHDDGFIERIKIRKERRHEKLKSKSSSSKDDDEE